MKTVMSAIAIAMLVAGGVAAAQEAPKVMGDLTRAEAQARAIDTFAKLDLNHDGKLDQADRAVREQQRFDRIDTDHNGQISREEFAAARMHRHDWHGHDAQGHGRPDGAAPPAQADARPASHDWHHGWGHRGGAGFGGGERMARWADTNHDGAISRDEFVAAALKRFDMADANHDGVVTRNERQAARMAMRDKWRAAHPRAPGDDAPAPPAG